MIVMLMVIQRKFSHLISTLLQCVVKTFYLTYPEVCHDIHLHGFLNQRVWAINKLLTGHNPSIVNQDIYFSDILLYLTKHRNNDLLYFDLYTIRHMVINHSDSDAMEEMFYLTTHSTHFIYGYMASDIW